MRRSMRIKSITQSSVANVPQKANVPIKSKASNACNVSKISRELNVPKASEASSLPEVSTLSEESAKRENEPDDLDIALANYRQVQEDKKKLDLKEVQALKKKFKRTVDTTKRQAQALDTERLAKPQAGRTRSGINRFVPHRAVYTQGKWVNKGLDDAKEKFDDAEMDYLKNAIEKFQHVSDLKFEHLKYLVIDIFFEELKGIKEGKIESRFHKRYEDLKGKSKADLFSEVRTSLFTNEQRDYINGLLQGAFDTTSKDDNGDIKHSDINYVEIVMLAEITIRIVKYVHKFKSNEEAFQFMIKSSREALGLGDDD